MRSMIPTASVVLSVVGGSAGALAQDVEFYGDAPYYYEYSEPAPPAYGYRSDAPGLAARPSSCGEFRYWNGRACVDARRAPPPVR